MSTHNNDSKLNPEILTITKSIMKSVTTVVPVIAYVATFSSSETGVNCVVLPLPTLPLLSREAHFPRNLSAQIEVEFETAIVDEIIIGHPKHGVKFKILTFWPTIRIKRNANRRQKCHQKPTSVANTLFRQQFTRERTWSLQKRSMPQPPPPPPPCKTYFRKEGRLMSPPYIGSTTMLRTGMTTCLVNSVSFGNQVTEASVLWLLLFSNEMFIFCFVC